VDDGRRLRGPAGQAFSSDQVQLSNLSANLSTNSPGLAAKLAHLTAAVGGGTYHVDAQAVSASILNETLRFSSLSHN